MLQLTTVTKDIINYKYTNNMILDLVDYIQVIKLLSFNPHYQIHHWKCLFLHCPGCRLHGQF